MLNYTLPPLTANKYAQDALKVLSKIESEVPEALSVMLRSDVVLTLSGVRAQTTYIDFPNHSGDAKQKTVAALQSCNIDLFNSESALLDLNEPENWWINHRMAYSDLPNRYGIEVFPVIKRPIDSFDSHYIWSAYVEAMIANLIDSSKELGDLPKYNMWTPHNIRFGMLLGYPGAAIESLCSLPEGEQGLEANISYHDMYDPAQPVYSFGSEAENDETTIEHQTLWSEILTNVYESDWHKEFASNLKA